MSSRPGLLFIVSAPSGTGKTTLVERLVQVTPDLRMSRSYTSRPPRGGETDGVDYNFIERNRFEAMAASGEFLEWADVFGNLYGTGALETQRVLGGGHDLVLVIDVQGARQVRQSGFGHVGIFILPPSFEVLEARLRSRSKDTEAQMQQRLVVARQEVDAVEEYDYVVINDEVGPAVRRLEAIVAAERSRLAAMRPAAAESSGAFASSTPKSQSPKPKAQSLIMSLIALGVTGGIGAYKAVEVARGLQKRGHDVAAIMTRSARRFVGPVTFEAITRRRVISDQWSPGANADIEHISLATDIALLVIAPATANVIGKLANGIADDFLTSLYLATRAPVLIAPAMNSNMLAHDAVQRNLAALAARGVRFVESGEGYLACGWIGKGRLAEPDDVVAAVEQALRRDQSLSGRRVVITAGPTYEDLDPVRFVGNRSSGRMGYALAAEAAIRGADVVLITGPTSLPLPVPDAIRVRTAAEMREAVLANLVDADVLVMAAAVANYTPAHVSREKIAHKDDDLVLTLVPTRDILVDAAAWRRDSGSERPLIVGFAAETNDVIERARAKRQSKGIDLIVANDVSRADAGFEADTNAVTLIGPDREESVPLASKSAISAAILDRIIQLLGPAGARVAAPSPAGR